MLAIVIPIDFIVILQARVEGVGGRGEYRREAFEAPGLGGGLLQSGGGE